MLRHAIFSPSAFFLCVCVLLAGCTSLLPKSANRTTAFESYESAHAALLALEPYKSRRADLEEAGFTTEKHPNTLTLNQPDVARRFLPSGMLRREDLAPGIRSCLEAGDACRGLEIVGSNIEKQRLGSFWSDFFAFRRETRTTGWRFTAVVLLVDDVVVYRAWSGQPAVKEVEVARNPLGPLQNFGPAIARDATRQ